MFFVGLFCVDFYRNFSKFVELLWVPPGFALYGFIPPGVGALQCGRPHLSHSTCRNSKYHQGTFAGYYAREGAFCYACLCGDQPRCRSPPSALIFVQFKNYKRKEIVMSAEMIKKVRELLDTYRDREWRIAVLRHRMKSPVMVSEDEIAEAMNFARGDGQGHTTGRVSNKTLYIALNYKEQAERLNAEAAEDIAEELFVLEHKQERLKLYVSLLDAREGDVIARLCFQKTPAAQVAEHFEVTERTIERIKKSAIEHLAEMYEYADSFKG